MMITMKRLATAIAAFICVLSLSSEGRSQDLKKFCGDFAAVFNDIKTSHPEWPFIEHQSIFDCLVRIEENFFTDATYLLSAHVQIVKSTADAEYFVNEYHTRMQRVV